jgi:hypothetical protein
MERQGGEQDRRCEESIREVVAGPSISVPHLDDQKLNIQERVNLRVGPFFASSDIALKLDRIDIGQEGFTRTQHEVLNRDTR